MWTLGLVCGIAIFWQISYALGPMGKERRKRSNVLPEAQGDTGPPLKDQK